MLKISHPNLERSILLAMMIILSALVIRADPLEDQQHPPKNIQVDLTGHQDIHQTAETRPLIIIRGGIVVTHDNEFPANVVIKDGKIIHIFSRTNPSWSIEYEHQVLLNQDGIDVSLQNVKIVDATGKYVMPGGIDPHVHLALPFSKFRTNG